MKTINELQNEVIEEFSDFDDWMDKYQLLIDLGNEQEPLAPEYKTEQNLIDGCQSRVWLVRLWRSGVCTPCASVLFRRGIVCRTFWKWADRDHSKKPVGK